MRVCMIGSGYVGLVTGTCLAELGHNVICVDKDKAKIGRLLDGHIPIYEPGLLELVESNRKLGKIPLLQADPEGLKKFAPARAPVVNPPPPSAVSDNYPPLEGPSL